MLNLRTLGLFSSLILATTLTLYAQDQTIKSLSEVARQKVAIEDTSHKVWRTGGIFNLNLSQGALSHWAAGGDKASFAINGLINAYAAYTKGKSNWNNRADIAYGYMKTSSTGFRKSDDHFYFTSQYGYQATENKKWYYSALLDFKTQFTSGYLYNDSGRTYNSDLFSPAYLLLSLGMNYKPADYFSLYLSPITERWTFVSSDILSSQGKYGVEPGKHSLNELGAFLSAQFNKDLNKSITLTSRLDLFSNYKHNPQNIDVYFTNLLSMKITKYLATTLSLNMIYDDDVRSPTEYGKREVPHLQIQEILGVGFSYKF